MASTFNGFWMDCAYCKRNMNLPSKGVYRLLARSRTRFAHVPVGRRLRAAASSYAFLRRLERRNSSLSSSGLIEQETA